MIYRWVTDLDRLGKYRNQIQIAFPNKDEIYVYRLGNSRYLLLTPNLKMLIWNTNKIFGGTYDIDELIKSSKDEKELFYKFSEKAEKYMLEML